MIAKVEAFFNTVWEKGFDMALFLDLIKEALAAIFGFVEKEETK